MARVTGVPLNYLLTRGQQIKVVSQMYRAARTENLIIPVMERQSTDQQYTGATVLEPKKGYYKQPIATLDFASLYPSIMMAHNLCYTSLISKKDAMERLKPEDYTLTPNGDCFVKAHKRPGLLPRILQELLGARKNAKRLMKTEQDPFKKAVLNGRQLALKVSANSVYGFTGATVGQLPCLAISSSVTAFGRDMIDATKNAVEKRYTIANGYKHNAVVIYGDTDSVMIKFGVDDVKEAMDLGREAAVLVTKEFINPIKLEFEKVYYPYLLMNKKRYAGLYWTNHLKFDKMDAKGIETVRRDSCRLVNDVVSTCLHKLLIEKSVEGALSYTKKVMGDLLMNKLDLSLLVISKQLGKSANADGYAVKVAHVELAERMRKRDPSTAPVVGDRVAYVITKTAKGDKNYQKAEDPVYVLENDIPIDTNYYMSNQLEGPLTRIFEPILGSVSQLFHGDHTRKVKISSGGKKKGGIMAFAVKRAQCLGCKVPLGPEEKVVCYQCRGNQGTLFFKQMKLVRKQEGQFSKLWTECQRCQSSLHQEVLCTSRDCPIFYRRIKTAKDLKQAQEKLDQFSF
jgi:DNA polymerase delta subunit 1